MFKNWKRWPLSALLAAVVMFADTVALAQVSRWYRPGHPPAWLTNCFYYFLAWPLPLTRLIFPRAAGDADEGPSFAAVASAGLIDLVLLTLLIYALLSRRARRKERAASV
jgi:hypothetical protein